MKQFLLMTLLFTAITVSAAEPSAAPASDTRMQWWSEARFGMFIHWDMSSVAGTEISWSRGATKPLDIFGHKAGYVEDPAYDNLYKKFNPAKFNATEWVQLAKDAGMKYIVFTAKHHGGFCMWDTKLTDYSIMNTPFKRDVVRELADACHKAGIRFGLYYSQRDWHHPDYGIGGNRKYVDYMNGQVRELLTNYGTVDVIWWDSYGCGDLVNFWRIGETFDLVKKLQPNIIMNNRLTVLANYNGQPAPYIGDFDTPEQRLGGFQNTRPWESCMSIVDAPGGGWSYRPDGHLKSFEACMKTLLGCATGDGNLLLDVGPDPSGVIPADQAGRLIEMGAWLKKHGDSIYGTRGGPYRNGGWGGSTYKGNTIYLHVSRWKGDRLVLPPLKSRIVKCSTAFEQTGESITFTLPAAQQDKIDTVITIQLDGPAVNELTKGRPIEVVVTHPGAVVKQKADGSLTLPAGHAAINGRGARIQDSEGIINVGYWTDVDASLLWNVAITKPGKFAVSLTYSCQPGNEGSEYTLSVGDQTLHGKIAATKGWNDFQTITVGEVSIGSSGPVTVVLQPASKTGEAVMNLQQLGLSAFLAASPAGQAIPRVAEGR